MNSSNLNFNPSAIADELKTTDQWCCWRTEIRDGKKPTKIPVNAKTGRKAKSNDKTTWTPFAEAVSYYQNHKEAIDGIGFFFSEDGPYTGIDLDDCVKDGELNQKTEAVVKKFNSYTDISPSKSGLHIIIRAKKPGDRCRTGKVDWCEHVEIYDTLRYFTFTGSVFNGYNKIEERQEELTNFYNQLFPKKDSGNGKRKTASNANARHWVSDTKTSPSNEDIVTTAMLSKNSSKFTALWNGNTSGYSSHSEADMAFCQILAFWTGKDKSRMDKLFRQSGLYRQKWEREDYRQRTINKAIQQQSEVYEPTVKKKAIFGKSKEHTTETDSTDNSVPKSKNNSADIVSSSDAPTAEEVAGNFLNEEFWNESENATTLRFWKDDWYQWSGRHYKRLQTSDLKASISKFLFKIPDRAVSKGFVNNIIQALTGFCLVSSEHTPPVWLEDDLESKSLTQTLSFKNGWMDFEAFLENTDPPFEKHNPRLFNTITLPYEFDQEATCPMFIKFLKQNLENDFERVSILQEFTGYCLTQDTTRHKFLMIKGEAGTGKSTFLDIITDLFGQDNVSNVPLAGFGQRFALQRTLGKFANIVSEVGELDTVAEGILKQFTAGDKMQFEKKYRQPTENFPSARVIIATNTLPRFLDRSSGIWRRLILMPFRVRVDSPDSNISVDRKLRQKIRKEELSGVFNWAIQGLARLKKNEQFSQSSVCDKAKGIYKEESNPASMFLNETIKKGSEEDFILTNDLYSEYSDFCEASGFHPLNKSNFGREIQRAIPLAEKIRKSFNGKREYGYSRIQYLD